MDRNLTTLLLQRFSAQQLRTATIAALLSMVGLAFSAQAGLVPVWATAKPAPAPVRVGYEAEDHFPGAAYFFAVEDHEAPSPGTTGTTALPDMPVPENAIVEATIRPAAPFQLAGGPVDKARALECLTTAIYYEAASEPDDGQRAVAQVILNRVRHPAFPASVCGVVYQGSERRGCQFSFACDGAMARTPMRSAWERARRVAARALAGDVFAPVGLATHYHTYAVTPSWNRSLVMTGVFGAHFFHRWKGWWGTAAAFRQGYSGSEPVPGPHARIDVPAPVADLVTAARAATVQPVPPTPDVKPSTPRENVQPAYADSGAVQPRYAEQALPESTILDKWKDSGRPLR